MGQAQWYRDELVTVFKYFTQQQFDDHLTNATGGMSPNSKDKFVDLVGVPRRVLGAPPLRYQQYI
jgi:hypothetical protein